MPCVFCGHSPDTKEHIFPQWLNRYLPEGQRQQLEQARYGADGYDITRTSVGLDFTVRKVCGGCNAGWMSALEAESIEVLDPLITRLDLQLVSLHHQRQVAVWAVKTAMMLDQTQSVPLLSQAELARMRTHRAIPRGTRIWMGTCDELFPLVTGHTVRMELSKLDEPTAVWPAGFYAPMKIGHLCLYVYFPPTDLIVQHPYRPMLARIWPRRGSSLPWPPPVRLTDGGSFESFADTLWRDLALFSRDRAMPLGLRDT